MLYLVCALSLRDKKKGLNKYEHIRMQHVDTRTLGGNNATGFRMHLVSNKGL